MGRVAGCCCWALAGCATHPQTQVPEMLLSPIVIMPTGSVKARLVMASPVASACGTV